MKVEGEKKKVRKREEKQIQERRKIGELLIDFIDFKTGGEGRERRPNNVFVLMTGTGSKRILNQNMTVQLLLSFTY